MNKQIVITLIAQLSLALLDGKITGDELAAMLNTISKVYGFDKGDFHEVFIEQDGDVHFILKKSCLDKMSISL